MVVQRLAHLLLPVKPQHLRKVSELALRLDQHLAEVTVEAAHNLAGEFQVGSLIHSHRDRAGLVECDVGSHQHRIADQAVVDVVRLLAHLLLERRQPGQPAQGGRHRKQKMQFGHLRHVRLDK